MPTASASSTASPAQRIWDVWSRFWFTPADPTPLCLMRIVAGLLALYVHIAYTFDLQALMGHDGWYSVKQANDERQQWPNFVPPSTWGATKPRFRLPPFPQQRATVRQFIDKLTS